MNRKLTKTPSRKGLIICSGTMPPQSILQPLLKEASVIICADGGANNALRHGITPDLIIGDMDSISSHSRRHFASIRTILISSQNSTDLEKALDQALVLRVTSVVVLGTTGRRSDHFMSNLSILAKYQRRLTMKYIDPYNEIEILPKRTTKIFPIGQILSLVPLGFCGGITTTGLQYPLTNEALALGRREGTSNRVISEPVTIRYRTGTLALFVVLKTR